MPGIQSRDYWQCWLTYGRSKSVWRWQVRSGVTVMNGIIIPRWFGISDTLGTLPKDLGAFNSEIFGMSYPLSRIYDFNVLLQVEIFNCHWKWCKLSKPAVPQMDFKHTDKTWTRLKILHKRETVNSINIKWIPRLYYTKKESVTHRRSFLLFFKIGG